MNTKFPLGHHLEASGAPVDELYRAFGFDGGDGSIDVLGHHIAPEEQAAGHVFTVTGVALHHLKGQATITTW